MSNPSSIHNIFILLFSITSVFISVNWVLAADVGSHIVSFNFQSIDEISISGNPMLTIATATPGFQPVEAVDGSAVLAITTNGENRHITARISEAMPANSTLEIQVAAPGQSGVSLGYVLLATSDKNVATDISHVADNNCPITYRLNASVDAGVLANDDRTIIFTLSD